MENIYSIYKISNLINDKVYIGYTSNTVKSRWSMHKYQARSGRSKAKIHEAMRTLGCDKFFVEVIYQSRDKEWTLSIEDNFIADYNAIVNGYNKNPGGQNTKNKQLTEYEREQKKLQRLEKQKLTDAKREQKKLQRAAQRAAQEEQIKQKEMRKQRRLERMEHKEHLRKIRLERKEKIIPHVRLLCKTCNINPRAINFHKNNKVYYRSQCDSCIKYTINEQKLGSSWYRAGYRKKSKCERCDFKPAMLEQLTVFQIDRNSQHVNAKNLKTVCLNCNYELSVTGWQHGDLLEDL